MTVNVKLSCVLALCLMHAAVANAAGGWTLEGDSLICQSEEAFDTQMQYLAQGVKQYAQGCGGSKKDYRVVVKEYNLLHPSKVVVVENGMTVWVNHESLKQN